MHPPPLCKNFSLTAHKSHLLPMPQATWYGVHTHFLNKHLLVNLGPGPVPST